MDFIPALSMNIAQSQLMTNVGTALLANSFEQAKTMGDSLTEMIDSAAMERSVHPEIGANIDVFV